MTETRELIALWAILPCNLSSHPKNSKWFVYLSGKRTCYPQKMCSIHGRLKNNVQWWSWRLILSKTNISCLQILVGGTPCSISDHSDQDKKWLRSLTCVVIQSDSQFPKVTEPFLVLPAVVCSDMELKCFTPVRFLKLSNVSHQWDFWYCQFYPKKNV